MGLEEEKVVLEVELSSTEDKKVFELELSGKEYGRLKRHVDRYYKGSLSGFFIQAVRDQIERDKKMKYHFGNHE